MFVEDHETSLGLDLLLSDRNELLITCSTSMMCGRVWKAQLQCHNFRNLLIYSPCIWIIRFTILKHTANAYNVCFISSLSECDWE